jgi:ssDNA-binding replication factor A large subunit
VDVIGVVHNLGQLSEINIKTSGEMRHKRILTLLDESAKMQVTMWSSNATLNYQMGKVIAIRGARVSDFQGKSLNSGDGNS